MIISVSLSPALTSRDALASVTNAVVKVKDVAVELRYLQTDAGVVVGAGDAASELRDHDTLDVKGMLYASPRPLLLWAL